MKARLIDIDGSDTIVEPENGRDFSLKELYKLLDTDIVQILVLPKSRKIMICDEEGKLKTNAQLNPVASNLWGDDVVGKVIVCESNMIK